MSDKTDLVERQLAAFRDRDLERFLAFYAPDVRVRDLDGNVMMDGLDAVRGMYGQLFRDSPELRVEIPRQMLVGDYVIDEEEISGFVMPGFPTEQHAVVIYRVQNGQIREVVLLH